MVALHLRYRGPSRLPVEVEGVTPDVVQGLSLPGISRLEIFQGNGKPPLAELFEVSGDASDGRIDWEGDLGGVHWMGARMSAGEIHIHGSAGRHAGSQMVGGEIHVYGDADDWLGAEMRGGLIHVRGRAGDHAGGAYCGSDCGMTGGVLLVDGDAGDEIGRAMRRGLLAVGGDAGDLAGVNLRAGTILVFGDAGVRAGAGMRRGTLGLFGPRTPVLLPTFVRACRYRPGFLPLLSRQLRRYGFPRAGDRFDFLCQLYHGDMLEGGRGEILARLADPPRSYPRSA